MQRQRAERDGEPRPSRPSVPGRHVRRAADVDLPRGQRDAGAARAGLDGRRVGHGHAEVVRDAGHVQPTAILAQADPARQPGARSADSGTVAVAVAACAVTGSGLRPSTCASDARTPVNRVSSRVTRTPPACTLGTSTLTV